MYSVVAAEVFIQIQDSIEYCPLLNFSNVAVVNIEYRLEFELEPHSNSDIILWNSSFIYEPVDINDE